MPTPESVFKQEIKKYLRTFPGIFFHSVPGANFGKNGVPDIVVCYKGRYIGIEAKTYEGVFSEWQKTRKTQIEAAGGIAIFARSLDDIKEVMEPMR